MLKIQQKKQSQYKRNNIYAKEYKSYCKGTQIRISGSQNTLRECAKKRMMIINIHTDI